MAFPIALSHFDPSFSEIGKRLYDGKKVKEIFFSRGTYQIEVEEEKGKSEYPFLQISEEGALKDSFCSCRLSEGGRGCPHLAAAYFALFKGGKEPLHVRYQHSFWAALLQMVAKRNGYERKALKKEVLEGKKEVRYTCASETKKPLFSISLKERALQKKFEALLAQKEETESTSIKFSNLPAEELALYEAKTPSEAFRFELSFWSDLAKWLFVLSEEEGYTLSFEGKALPEAVLAVFPSLDIWAYIARVSWPFLVAPLSTVASPLRVFSEERGGGGRFFYDEEKKELRFEEKKEKKTEGKLHGEEVGAWLFIPGEGFFPREKSSFAKICPLKAEEIAAALDQWGEEIGRDLPVRFSAFRPQHRLFFDEKRHLHIEMYLFEPGDLSSPRAALFAPWAYLPGKGFYRLEELLFEEKEKVIPPEEMGEFINRHRMWLQQFPGFRTHLGSLQSHLVYGFDGEGNLFFKAETDFPQEEGDMLSFDEWTYVKGEGFYKKKEGGSAFPIYPGLLVLRREIGPFLESQKEALELVHSFFCKEKLVERMGLSLRIEEGGCIEISPEVQYAEGIEPSQVEMFGSYLYAAGRGFAEIPPLQRLPERYREKVKIEPAQESSFLAYDLEPLRPYILSLDPKLMRPSFCKLELKKIVKERGAKGRQWLVELSYHSEIGRVDPFFLWEALHKKKKHLFSPAGLLFLKEPRFHWLRSLTKRRFLRAKNRIRLTTLEWLRLTLLEEIALPTGGDPEAAETRALFEELSRFTPERFLDVSRLKSTLRPYQEEGLKWLWFLYCHGLSGLLCDDMGLGKTHQAMALLAAVLHEDPEKKNKYLVVCPTSVIYHWQELLRRFLPELRVCTYYGLARSLDSFSSDFDLLLTSYGILRTGKEDLQGIHFEVVVYDEIQVAKNHASQTHAALRAIRAEMRLGLTGTPIENRIRELKALLDLVLPSYLPQDALFREMFIQPIEKHQDAEKKALLRRLIKPFLLRRRKSEVLLDLPEKIEEIAYCDLSEIQKKLYRDVALRIRGSLYEDLRDPNKPVSYVHVFSALSSLKRICNHPALVLSQEEQKGDLSSGKWDLFVELLDEAHESGQKVVVFSQYLEMLALIEKHLKKKGIEFAGIKGATRDRNEQLLRFRQDPGCTVFVASLLAAGVGIDLTVASIVIHYDRWWNPAKENQATDRVHRIGQNRGVQVFKLVTKHTIEEHIHAMIERKKGLLEDVIGVEDQIQYLSREELVQVFEKVFQEIH